MAFAHGHQRYIATKICLHGRLVHLPECRQYDCAGTVRGIVVSKFTSYHDKRPGSASTPETRFLLLRFFLQGVLRADGYKLITGEVPDS